MYHLKNCPFYRKTAFLYQFERQEHYIMCDVSCTSSALYPTEEEAIFAWNTRFEPKTNTITKLQYNKNTLKYIDDEPWHNRIKYTNDKPWKTM